MASNWKTLLISSDRRILSEVPPLFSQHLPGALILDVQEYPSRNAFADMILKQKPALLLLDVWSDRDRALQMISEAVSLDPAISVIALHQSNDPDLILKTLRQGAIGFMTLPFTPEQLMPLVDRIMKVNPSLKSGSAGKAKIYLVMPAKGACGATTVAASLAFQWKRFGSKKSLLADLDPLTGTLAFLLKVRSTYSFLDVLSRAGTLDADLWKGMVSTLQGVDVLLSPENLVNGISELHDSSTILEFARQAYDTVTIDCNGAYGDWSLNMARNCDELLLVTTNELPALQATQRTLSYLDHHRVDRNKIRLIVNRYNRDVGLSKEVIGTALHTEVFHVIPSDYEAVNKALMDGKPSPSSTGFGKSIATLAERLVGLEAKENGGADVPPPKKASRFNLFGLFGN